MAQGVDVWLNNPRRPLEASGTSGQKVCINGGINFSILDGWWCEGYNGNNGWSIGDKTFYENEYYQDVADSNSIYDSLEKMIVPLYYDRDKNGIPVGWVKMMKESIKSLTYKYSTNRMVQDYMVKMYLPSIERTDRIMAENFNFAKELASWKTNIERSWPQVQVLAEKYMDHLKDEKMISGESLSVSASVILGSIEPSSVKVEVYYGNPGKNNTIENPEYNDMTLQGQADNGIYRYTGSIRLVEGGDYGYTFRVLPYHPDLINKFDLGLIRWVVQ